MKKNPNFESRLGTPEENMQTEDDALLLLELFRFHSLSRQRALNVMMEILSTMLRRDYPDSQKREALIDEIAEAIKMNSSQKEGSTLN